MYFESEDHVAYPLDTRKLVWLSKSRDLSQTYTNDHVFNCGQILLPPLHIFIDPWGSTLTTLGTIALNKHCELVPMVFAHDIAKVVCRESCDAHTKCK